MKVPDGLELDGRWIRGKGRSVGGLLDVLLSTTGLTSRILHITDKLREQNVFSRTLVLHVNERDSVYRPPLVFVSGNPRAVYDVDTVRWWGL